MNDRMVTSRCRRAAALAVAVMFAAACEEEPTSYLSSPEAAFDLIGGDDVGQVFVVTNTADFGAGSLRQAIEDANAVPGLDGIAFDIPGGGPHKIQPAVPLPPIFDPVVMDGYTQPGAGPNTSATPNGTNAVLGIELDGSAAGPFAPGLVIVAGGSTVRGLAINGFHDGVVLVSGSNRVRGNFIGTDPTGTSAAPNRGNGVLVFQADNVVGGSQPADRNVISGNVNDGVRIEGPGAVRNLVAGNFLGTDASGATPIPNGLPDTQPINSAAVHILGNASENLVGGPGVALATCEGPCNVISGNERSGVWIEGFAHHNTVQGNLIGTSADGAAPLGNGRFGVALGAGQTFPPVTDNLVIANRIEWSGRDGIALVGGSSRNTIGGSGVTPGACDGPCNRIAFNGQSPTLGGDGIRIYGGGPLLASGNSFLGNSISENPRGQAIDIFPNGPTLNDPGDLDVGENGLQNFPELTSATTTPGRLLVRGTIDTPNPERALIEIYGNPVPTPGADESGYGEAAVFLGRAAPDAQGSFVAGLRGVAVGTLISATATDEAGNTSELALNIEALPPRGPDGSDHPSFHPFSFTVGGCTEPIQVTGAFHDVFQFRSDAAGGTHFQGHITAVGVGVGQFTGAIYNWNDAINDQGSFRGAEQTSTSIQNTRLIGRGGASDLRFQARFHITVTPQGVVSVLVSDFSFVCS